MVLYNFVAFVLGVFLLKMLRRVSLQRTLCIDFTYDNDDLNKVVSGKNTQRFHIKWSSK